MAYGLVSSAYETYSGTEDEETKEDTEADQNAEAKTGQTEEPDLQRTAPAAATQTADLPKEQSARDADGGQVDQRVTVSTTVDGDTQAPAGQRLKVDVNATYSGANQNTTADIWIRLDGLTDDLSLVGFSADGTHTVVTTQKKEIVVELVKENGVILHPLPAGAGRHRPVQPGY